MDIEVHNVPGTDRYDVTNLPIEAVKMLSIWSSSFETGAGRPRLYDLIREAGVSTNYGEDSLLSGVDKPSTLYWKHEKD